MAVGLNCSLAALILASRPFFMMDVGQCFNYYFLYFLHFPIMEVEECCCLLYLEMGLKEPLEIDIEISAISPLARKYSY